MLYPLSYERWVVRFYGRRKQDANAVPGTGVACAEREGFEPSDPVSQVNSLAVSPIRPLSHLSGTAAKCLTPADTLRCGAVAEFGLLHPP